MCFCFSESPSAVGGNSGILGLLGFIYGHQQCDNSTSPLSDPYIRDQLIVTISFLGLKAVYYLSITFVFFFKLS